jgi:hypothetical protein
MAGCFVGISKGARLTKSSRLGKSFSNLVHFKGSKVPEGQPIFCSSLELLDNAVDGMAKK